MRQTKTNFDYLNDEQYFKIDFLSSFILKSRLTDHLTVEDNDSVKYRIAFTLDAGAEVNVLPKTFLTKCV